MTNRQPQIQLLSLLSVMIFGFTAQASLPLKTTYKISNASVTVETAVPKVATSRADLIAHLAANLRRSALVSEVQYDSDQAIVHVSQPTPMTFTMRMEGTDVSGLRIHSELSDKNLEMLFASSMDSSRNQLLLNSARVLRTINEGLME